MTEKLLDTQVLSSDSTETNFSKASASAVKDAWQSVINGMRSLVASLDDQSKLENVAIFVDYDNVYWSLKKNYGHDPDDDDPNKNLFVRLWNRYQPTHVRSFRVYADFEKIKADLTSLQKKRIQIRHVYSNGKDADKRKNSSDIELCIDAIESTYKDPSITCYVFVTADSDMIPILSRMMYKGKRVELYYLREVAPKHVDMASFADTAVDLAEFLNLPPIEYDVNQLIVPALLAIDQWEKENKNNKSVWLGDKKLNRYLESSLNLPEKAVSEVIEELTLNQLITKIPKETNQGRKLSIVLTEHGRSLLNQESVEPSTIRETATGKSNVE